MKAEGRALADLKVLLAFPPQGHPTQPYLALPSLKAFLAEKGLHDCTVWDLNLEAYDRLVSNERLALSLQRIQGHAQDWGMDDKEQLDPGDLDRFRLYADAMASGPYLATHADKAKEIIRDREAFYDREQYLWAMRTFESGLKLLSTEYYPTLFTAHNYTQSTSIDSSSDLFAGVDNQEENLFAEFFEEEALPRIEKEMPDVLGLSVTYGSQLVPTLTLASMVKKRWPGIHIILGGGMLAYVGHRLGQAGPLFDRCDSIAVYEGERTLLEVCEAVAASGGVHRSEEEGAAKGTARGIPDLSNVANLIYSNGEEVVTNGELLPMPIDDLPTPDFRDLPLDQYLSGELVLPIAPTRGCYFEKCGFCTLYTAIGPTYRERSTDRLVEDLQTLKTRHGTPYFYFIMDDLPPLLAKQIPDAFKEAQLEVYWWCDARMEERIFNSNSLKQLYDSGCRKLMFGFESGSQRLLDLVEKGVDLEEAERVLRAAHEAGISTTLYTMVGLPTETREEAEMTRSFIVRNADRIGEISLQIFNLDMVSPMYRDPSRFGIATITDDPRDLAPGEEPQQDLARYLACEAESGMTREEVKMAFNNILGAATEALPALRGDNFLYYRYKSHIFLYLCHSGIETFRKDQPPPRLAGPRKKIRQSADLPQTVSLRDDVTLTPLAFSYGQVRSHLDRVWSDPTPLGGIARSESHASTQAHPLPPIPSMVAFVGQDHRFFEVGADTAKVWQLAANEGVEAALFQYGEKHRSAVGHALANAVDEGLLVPDSD